MENTEGRRGNTRCSLRSPEFEVSVGHPGGRSSPGEPRYWSEKLGWTQLLQSLVERNQRVKEGAGLDTITSESLVERSQMVYREL